MSTLSLRAPHVPTLPVTGFGRIISAVVTLLDVLTEAQSRARLAHQQYPFADW